MNLETAGPSPNPFTYIRPISEPQRFVGRRDETREIFSLLGAADFGSCSIVGARRSGKTSLLNFISHPDTIRQHGLDPAGVTFSQTEVSHVLALTGTLPFLVHMSFELLYEEWQRDPEEASRLGSLEARFHEAAIPHLESSWRHSSERHKTILSLLTLLAGQQDGQRTYWKWEQLESWYCCRSTILSVGNCSGKMSVYGRTDIEYERAEPVTYLERSIRAALDDEGGGPAAWSK